MAEHVESSKPFFSRARTRRALSILASSVDDPGRLVIYAGAGVTVDRSGLNWRKMVEGLIEPYVPDQQLRDDIFAENSIQAAASLAVEYYLKQYGMTQYRARIADRLRILIYAPGSWQSGELIPALSDLAAAVRCRGAGFVAATTNYDDYLIEGLRDGLEVDEQPPVVYPYEVAGADDFLGTLTRVRQANWLKSRDATLQLFSGAGTIVHLHGLIPRDSSIESGRVVAPVVGEIDYVRAASKSFQAMRALLRQGPALFVGASLTDSPLLQALEATKDVRFPRYALVPMGFQFEDDSGRLRELRTAQLERFEHFGVTPIYVDYYFQIAQFVSELARLVSLAPGDDDDIESGTARDSPAELAPGEDDRAYKSYGSRLVRWSADWGILQDQPVGGSNGAVDDVNWLSQSLLELVLGVIREMLDTSASETMKIEFWVRDAPTTFRGLRLWQSSASIHLQEDSARRANFSNHSRIAAVKAFVAGRPISVELDVDKSPNQRWRTYIALPVRLSDDSGEYGKLPVGALVVASRRHSEFSSLARPWRHEQMSNAMALLEGLGDLLTRTHMSSWRSVSRSVR